ncbi:MAG: acetolactate synthase large subunit [Candidatus Altimarinota bacterium]
MKASDIFVQMLESYGVDRIYGVPGEENLDFIESLRNSNIKLILTRNEQTAVFMAANHGRFTGNPGVALATLGPGATNMVTGVAYAQLSGLPLIVITGQKPIKKSKQGLFQIIDVVGMMRPITKYATTIISGSRIPSLMHNAWKIARSERPGVVAIEFPEDIALEDVRVEDISAHTEKIRRPVIDEKMLEKLISELEKVERPIILIGAGANRKQISKYLESFIKKYHIPFFTSQMGKGVVNESLPEYLGTASLTQGDYIHQAIAQSDLIISVGYDPIEKPTTLMGVDGTPSIYINFYEAHIDDVYAPYLEVIGDIGNIFWRLSEAKIEAKWDFEEIYRIKDQYTIYLKNHLTEEIESPTSVMGPRMLTDILRRNMESADILTLDNGLYKVWISRNYPCYGPNTLILDNALATMGAGLSSAMSAKLEFPDKRVVCVTGDGGLVMNLGDIETAVRLSLDITLIVLNNGSYGMIEWKQEGGGMEKWGLKFGNPDFVKLAESFGARGFRVEKKYDFESTLKKALEFPGLKIIDLVFDYPKEIK